MKEKEKSRINELKQWLYNKNTSVKLNDRTRLKKRESFDLKENWKPENDILKSSFDNQNLFKYKNKKTNIFFIFFIFSLIFLVFTASFAFFYLFFLKDDISNQFLTMEIIGPNNVKSGDIFEYKIKINNSTDIKYRNLKLVIRYPDLSVDTVSRLPIKNRIVEIERDLMPNSFIFKNFNLSLFGSRGQERDILIKLYYTPENSSAILSKSKIYRLIMKDSPVLVEVNIPEKTLSKEKFSGNFSIKSTSKQDLNDLLIVVNHSQSFEFIDFDIEPVFSSLRKKAFIIPNLKYEGIKEINFSAKLLGHLEEENFFSVEVGKGEDFVINPNNLFIKKEDKISIIAEDFDFRITATGRKQNVRNIFVGYPNSKIDLNLRLKNNSDYNIHDLEIKTKIEGDFFNKRTVSVDDGFFSSKNNKIIWNKNTNRNFDTLLSKEHIKASFSLDILPIEIFAGRIKDPKIKLNFKFSGFNVDGLYSDKILLREEESIIKIPTQVNLKTNIFFEGEPFINTGNREPIVDKQTTYTAVWEISNSTSDIENVRVVAKLPPYVEFLNEFYPKSAYISYNPENREVTWSFKRLSAFIGYRTPPRKVYFKIGFTPSSVHLNRRQNLITNKILTAEDSFIENRKIKLRVDPTSSPFPIIENESENEN